MTDEAQIDDSEARGRAVRAILRGVAIKTAIVVSAAAAAALGFSLMHSAGQWWFLPLSVIFGGALGLVNFRWLAAAVQKVYLRQGATPGVSTLAAAIISILKLFIIFIILFIVIKWQLVHVFGLVAGLSFCFLAIIWEGATIIKDNLTNRQS